MPVESPGGIAQACARRTTENGERVLRVTAERLNSLLDLSSKSLVETLRLKPHLATMQRLKRMQSNSQRALENLNVHLKEQALSLEAREALEDARRLLAESQQLLVEKNAELDEFAWQASQRAQVLYDTALACRMRPFADVLDGAGADGPRPRSQPRQASAAGDRGRKDPGRSRRPGKTRSATDSPAAQRRRSRYRKPGTTAVGG